MESEWRMTGSGARKDDRRRSREYYVNNLHLPMPRHTYIPRFEGPARTHLSVPLFGYASNVNLLPAHLVLVALRTKETCRRG